MVLIIYFHYNKASNTCTLNPNYVLTAGLQNYWSFCSSLTDLMTNLTLYNEMNPTFTFDRFNVSNSAISLSNGFVKAPGGVYFSGGDYTVMAWVYPRAFISFSRLLDFGNGAGTDNICFALTYSTSGQPQQYIYKGASNVLSLNSSQMLELNKWQHLTFTFLNSTKKAKIYVNGVLTANGTSNGSPNNVARTSNYIGKSNNAADGLVNAIYDEIKIFNIALSQLQIVLEQTNDYYQLVNGN